MRRGDGAVLVSLGRHLLLLVLLLGRRLPVLPVLLLLVVLLLGRRLPVLRVLPVLLLRRRLSVPVGVLRSPVPVLPRGRRLPVSPVHRLLVLLRRRLLVLLLRRGTLLLGRRLGSFDTGPLVGVIVLLRVGWDGRWTG